MNEKVLSKITCVVIAIPIIAYSYVILSDSVDFPFFDDYYAVLEFLNFYKNINSSQKFNLLFSQNNEHKITTTYLANVFLTNVFGEISLRHLIIAANLFLGGIIFFLYKTVTFKKNLLYFIPIIFIIFQPLYYELSLWPMASFSHIACTFFALSFLYFIHKQGLWYFVIAIISFFLASFSNGNGIFVLPIGLLILAVQKRYKLSVVLFVIGLTAAYFYFFVNYRNVHHNDYGTAITRIQEVLTFYFTLLGSCTDVFSKDVSLFLGIGLIAYFCYISMIKLYYKINTIIFSACLFLFGTMLLISVSRYIEGIGMAHRSLYTFYSILLFVLLYISFVEIYLLNTILGRSKIKNLVIPLIFIIPSIFYWAISYTHLYPSLLLNKYERIAELIDWKNKSSVLYLRPQNSGYVLNTRFQDILSVSSKNDLYFPELSLYTSKPIKNEEYCSHISAKPISNTTFEVNRIEGNLSSSSDYIRIMGKINEYTPYTSTGEVYLVLKSKSHCYLFTIYRSLQFNSLGLLNKLNNLIYNPYFFALISKKDLLPDIYQIGFLNISGKHKEFSITTSTLDSRSILQVENYVSSTWHNANMEIQDSLTSKVVPINSEIDKGKLKIVISADKSLWNPENNIQPYIFLKTNNVIQFYSCISLSDNKKMDEYIYYSSIPLEEIEGVYENNKLTHQVGLALARNDNIINKFITNFNLTSPAPSIRPTLVDYSGPFKYSDSVRFNIDHFEKAATKINIGGWALIQPKKIKISKIYLALFTAQDTMFIKTRQVSRPDVYNAFDKELSGNFNYTGFYTTVEMNNFEQNIAFKPALVIEDQNKIKYFQPIHQYENEFKVGCSRTISLGIPAEISNINCYVDALQSNGECIDMVGWCHIDGQGAETQKVFFIFKSDTRQFIFPANTTSRFDVDNVFKERGSKLDLKLSGFQVSIPKADLIGSSYTTGVLIQKDGQTYFKWLNQSGYNPLNIQ